MENSLKHRQIIPRFRVLMSHISEDLISDDLTSVKFLLRSKLSGERIEHIKNFLDVITELEKLDLVSPERVDLVEEYLLNINRKDLAKKVNAYKIPAETPGCHLPQQESFRASQVRQELPIQIARQRVTMAPCRQQNVESSLHLYKFNSNPRGVCVIIDCVGIDGEMLEETFKALQFSVAHHKYLNASEILSTLKGALAQREVHRGDAYACCIISRGTGTHLLGTDSHSGCVSMADVRRLFTAGACPMLAGKPKLLFIQKYCVPEYFTCERTIHDDEDIESDACDGPCVRNPTDADLFWSHSWTAEHQLQQGQHRSIYLQALTVALRKAQARKVNLLDVQREVSGAIFTHNERNSGAIYGIEGKHTLRKELYLE
ncbi:CASP8 and FADD-like apoptosis regulator [Pholidichthys leucotaenia]